MNRNKKTEWPADRAALEGLFEYLWKNHALDKCDGTLAITTKYLSENDIETEVAKNWLQEHGGFCDCEVLFNTTEHINEIR